MLDFALDMSVAAVRSLLIGGAFVVGGIIVLILFLVLIEGACKALTGR